MIVGQGHMLMNIKVLSPFKNPGFSGYRLVNITRQKIEFVPLSAGLFYSFVFA
jgi:hypothetical protein